VRLLLDTHTWLWFYLGDSQLSQAARSLIEDAGNAKLVSPASCWEAAIKISIGKLQLREPYEAVLRHSIVDNGFAVLPIEDRHVVQVSGLAFPPGHKDPFDRLLVAQAMVENIPIVSADVQLDSYPVRRLW
jgi:PIN domain nuclease of toxin-antitoxin system